jgi:predicted DCC family thiol-disulfide oxidoreductase YuxK
MLVSQAQPPAPTQGAHLLLYDGVCGLCNHLVQFLLKHDRRGAFSFASLQSATGKTTVGRWGGNPDELTSFYIVMDFRTPNARPLKKSDAALFVAGQLGWPWRVLQVGGLFPRVLRDALYDVIARTRYRVFGRYEQCLMPREEFRSRFVE